MIDEYCLVHCLVEECRCECDAEVECYDVELADICYPEDCVEYCVRECEIT